MRNVHPLLISLAPSVLKHAALYDVTKGFYNYNPLSQVLVVSARLTHGCLLFEHAEGF